MQPLKAELPKGSDAVLRTPKLQGSEELLFPLELETRVEVVPLWLVMLKAASWQGSATVSVRGVLSAPTTQPVPVGLCLRPGKMPFSTVLALGF